MEFQIAHLKITANIFGILSRVMQMTFKYVTNSIVSSVRWIRWCVDFDDSAQRTLRAGSLAVLKEPKESQLPLGPVQKFVTKRSRAGTLFWMFVDLWSQIFHNDFDPKYAK